MIAITRALAADAKESQTGMRCRGEQLKQQLNKSKNFSSTLKYCFDLSWQSSRFYTLIRIGAEILNSLITIFLALLGKWILNLLAEDNGRMDHMVLFLLLIGTVKILININSKAVQYTQSMYDVVLTFMF